MMKKMDRSMITPVSLIRFLSVFVLTSLLTVSAQAATPAGWIDQQAELVSSEEAALLLEQREQQLSEQRTEQSQHQSLLASDSMSLSAADALASSAMAMTAAAEYSQLAEALENDPRRIYQFVRNHFKYEPYYGALKGAFLTLKERSGNDFDQAALLVELLRAAGFTANFQYGTMDIPHSAADNQDTAHWLGSEADANVVGGIIATGGIPASNYIDHIVMDRVWVVAEINGTTYALDPAFKPSTQHSGIDLSTAMGYDQAALLNAAGGLIGTNSIENLDNSNLNSTLDNLTSQLLTSLKLNHPNAHLHDIIGGLTIIPDDSSTLPSGLAFPVTVTQPVWIEIPQSYVHTVRLQHGGIDSTLDIPSIAGKKLSIQYAGDSVTIDPPPAGATDFGSVAPGQDGPTFTWSPGNSNAVVIQVTSTITGTDASAFAFVAGGGTQNIPANNGTVDVKVKLSGQGQTAGRKNANLTFSYSYQGNPVGTPQVIQLTGAVESTPVAQIYLDDTLLIDEVTPSGNLTDFIISVDHPYAGVSGTFADQSATFILNRSGTYVLASGFGGDKNSTLLAERQRQLDQMLLQGMADSDPKVLSETLNIMGQNWFKQTQLNAELLGRVSDRRILRHHRFGMVGQEEGYFIDVKAQFSPTLALTANAAEGAFQASGLIASAMEHSVLEQLQGADKPAISTIKIFNLNNQNGDKFFLANQANFGSIQGQLTGYTANDLSNFQSAVNNNGTLILPKNGQLTLNQWSGKGYVDYRVNGSSRSLGMIIGGGLNGGFNSTLGEVSATKLSNTSTPSYTPAANILTQKAVDPVDLGSGAYLNLATDLSLGGSGAKGLSFGRNYNSQQVNQNTAYMAPGWTHSYAISIDEHSDLDSALGKRTPQDVAALLVSAYISRDLMQATQPSLKAWVTSALIAQWATDQLIDKTVSIKLGDRVLSYRQQPDGSFTPPPGITTKLIKLANGNYQLQERFGTVLSFNADHKIQSLTDIDGHALNFSYTGDRLDQVTDSYNRTLTLNYVNNRLASVNDNQGRSVSYSYDTNGDLSQYQDAENKQWQYGYDSQHQILTVIDPVNVTIVDNIYDDKGRVIQQTAPRDNNTFEIYKLHYTGLSAAEEDPEGKRLTYHYDFTGRTIKTENALGHSSKVSYDGQGQMIQQTDPKGNTSQQQYDGFNNLKFASNALSQQTEFVYDSQQRLTQVIDPLSHTSEIDYDTSHRPFKFRNGEVDENNQPIESQVSYYLSGAHQGKIHTQTDARGAVTTLTYDSFGFTDSTKTGAHPAVNTDYNAIGQMTSLTDQQGTTTSFDIYDKRGLLKQSTDPLNKTSNSTYDDVGRIKTQTDRNGDITTLSYTPTSKLKKISYQDSTEVSFNYDSRDNLDTMVDPSGTTTNHYDDINRLTEHTDPHGFQVQYAYDENGNLETLTYPGTNKTVSYSYDALNRLKTAKINWLTNTPTTTYHYDVAGRMHQTEHSNGTITNYSHDNANRLKGVTHTTNNPTETIADYQYTLDANGNRIKALVEAPILPEQLINDNLSYSYNPQKNRLNSTSNDNYSYDDEGQLQTKGSTSFSFDHAHRLISQSNHQYTYDGVGNRIKATRNGVITKYIYDAAGNLLAEADNNNQITRYYIYGHGMTGFVEASTNQLYTYHHDGTGHTVAITDQSQNIINSYAYDPYGNIMGEQESIAQPFKYVGQLGVFAEANNLYYMRARYYDAEVGRFISEDPIGFAGGLNLYAYVGGNPVNYFDPTGEVAWVAAGAFVGGAINLATTYYANDGNITLTQGLASFTSGAISGGIGALAGPLGGSIAKSFGAISSGAVAVTASAIASGAGGYAGQVAANNIDPSNHSSAIKAAAFAAGGGGIAKLLPTKNLNTISQAGYFGPKSLGGLFNSKNSAWLWGASSVSAGVGAAANFK